MTSLRWPVMKRDVVVSLITLVGNYSPPVGTSWAWLWAESVK